VAAASEMKRDESELAVEYSFIRFREWVEVEAARCGGRVQSAAGDGITCVFPDDASALRAARRLQAGIDAFNAEHNRLRTPFRLRCGVSAGLVAVDAGMPALHNPVVDRAAALQSRSAPGDIVVSGELASAALVELGSLSALPEPVHGEPAFSWQGRAALSPQALTP
jgi:class 3 adenylate cyclase